MFDIDKIFISMKSYSKKDGKLSDKFEESSMEYHQNRLLDDYIALLCDTIEKEDGTKITRSMHMLHASIDNDTSLIEDVIDDLEEGGHKKPLSSYDAYTLRHMCRAKDDFITGKTGIGPYALNNNSQVLTTLYEVEFAEAKDSIMTRLGLNSLHNQFDRDGESIMSWLSGLINIHVDVAKDPKHNKLNINGYTHNLVNLLIRTGFGKTTFYFTTQPIMKELATIINNASGKYMLEKGVSLSKLKKDAEQQFIMNIAKANGIQGKTFGRVMNNWIQSMHKRQVGINSTIDWLLQEGSYILRDIAKSGEGMNSKKTYEVQTMWDGKPHTEVMSVFDIQMLIYKAFNQFTPYAEALSNLVKYSKIDTKKHGKNLMEQKRYMQGYHAMFDSDSQDKNRLLFKTDGLDRLRDKTYIGHMTENAIGVFNDIMGSQIILGTDRFIGRGGLMDSVLSAIGRYGTTDDQLLRAVSSSILAKKKATFFNEYAYNNDIDVKGLVDGNETIYNRLCKIKSEIICTEKYKSLLDGNGNIRNYLLRTLVAGYTHDFVLPKSAPYGSMQDDYKSVKFVNTLNFIDDESIDQDEFILAWDDLLNDTRFPELQKFARDLIVYAFITAGDNGGRHDLMKFVPNSWKIQSGYVDEMVRLLDRFNDKTISLDATMSREDIEDIILNNWYDDNFVHTVNVGNIRPFYSKVKQLDGSIKSTQFPTVIGLPSGTSIESEYIKIARENVSDPESQRRYVLYKRMGMGKHEEVVERMIDGKPTPIVVSSTYPIYVAVEPRGNRFTDRHVILSYGRQESAKESLTNMCLDALAMGVLTHNGVKAENTEQIFAMLSKIFHELDPVVRDLSRQKYDSQIQDVVEEYNKHEYALEDAAAEAMNAQDLVLNYGGNWTREDVANDPKSLYIFTDNTDRDSGRTLIDPNSEYAKKYGADKHYPTTTQAVVRGLNNAMPISTQRWYHDGAKGETGRWTDDSFDEFKKTIDEEFDAILEEWKTGKYNRIVFGNKDGLFNTKISNITEQRTPKIYKYLKDKLSWFKNEVNILGNRSLSTPTTAEEAERRGESVYEVPGGQPVQNQNSTKLEDGKVYDADYILNAYKNTFVGLHKPYFKLADAVFARAKELGIQFKVNKLLRESGVYHKDTNIVEYNTPENQNHNTLLHEAIHAVVAYQISLSLTNPELLSKEELAAVKELEFVYKEMRKHFLSDDPMARSLELLEEENYGLNSIDEFVAELSSHIFRARILDFDKVHDSNIFERLINAVFKILGINKQYTSAENTAYQALKTLLEHTNSDTFQKANLYYKFRRQLENSEKYVNFYVPFDMEKQFLSSLDKNSKHRTIRFVKDSWNSIFTENDWNKIEPGRMMYMIVGKGRILARIESKPIVNDNMYEIKYSVIHPSEYINLNIEDGIILDSPQPIYKDTAKLKSAISGAFVSNRLAGGVGLDDINIGIQTESKNDGKYVTITAKNSKDIDNVREVLQKLQEDSNMEIQIVERNGKFLVSRDSYRTADIDNTDNTDNVNYSQYNLSEDFASEMLRMLSEDKELFNEYVSQLGREQMERCGII